MALSDAERMKAYRERKRNGDVTPEEENVTVGVTEEGPGVTESVTNPVTEAGVTLVTAGNVTERLAAVASRRDLRIKEMQRGRDVTGLVHAPAGKVRRVVDVATMSEAEMKMVPGVWLGPSKEQLAALGSTSLGGRK